MSREVRVRIGSSEAEIIKVWKNVQGRLLHLCKDGIRKRSCLAMRRLNQNPRKSESLQNRDNPDGHPERDGGSSPIAAERWGRRRCDIRRSGRSRGMKDIDLST